MEHFYPQPSFVKLGWGLFLFAQFLFYVCSQMESLALLETGLKPKTLCHEGMPPALTQLPSQTTSSYSDRYFRTDSNEPISGHVRCRASHEHERFFSKPFNQRPKEINYFWVKKTFFAEPLNELKLKCLAGTCSIKMLQLWMNIKYLFCSIHAY